MGEPTEPMQDSLVEELDFEQELDYEHEATEHTVGCVQYYLVTPCVWILFDICSSQGSIHYH
jgi:quinol monooxygenase YgiN